MSVITPEIKEFLAKQLFAHLGTRDKDLKTSEVFAWAITPGNKESELNFFIPEAAAAKALENLKDNGQIALTAVFVFTHESYQFKGKYLSHRLASADEQGRLDKIIGDYKPLFETIGLPVSFLDKVDYDPAILVSFHVEDVFVQTPGPGAGKNMNERANA